MNRNNLNKLIFKSKFLSQYKGEDRIISSTELKKIIDKINNNNNKQYFCGMKTLDSYMKGFKRGNLVIIGGYPGEGKSTLGRTLTRKFIVNGVNCLWFQFEETESEFLSHFGDNIPEFFIPKSIKEKTIDWITDRIIESKVSIFIPEDKRPEVVFIDNLEMIKNNMLYNLKTGLNEASLYGLITQQIKNLAIDFKLIIFLMSNSNRSEGKGRQAILDDTSYTGSQQIAHIADSCWSIWRKKDKGKDWNEPPKMYNEALLNISKNRGVGRKCGVIKLRYQDDNFIEIEDKEDKENKEDLNNIFDNL